MLQGMDAAEAKRAVRLQLLRPLRHSIRVGTMKFGNRARHSLSSRT